MEPLGNYRADVFSQYGEDGLIREALKRIADVDKLEHWCVEFGAWDGVLYSNSRRLIIEEQYSAVLIEGDWRKAKDITKNYPNSNVHVISAFVDLAGNSLDNLLARTPCPRSFDLLSVDVDGMDFHIVASLQNFQPKIICVEFNQTIPNFVQFVQSPDPQVRQGASALALSHLASTKGYALVAATDCNLIFVRKEYLSAVAGEEQDLAELNPRGNQITAIFSGYDGTILSNQSSFRLGWHDLGEIGFQKIQIIPKRLRLFPPNYGPFRRLVFWVWSFSISRAHRVRKTTRSLRLIVNRVAGRLGQKQKS